MPIDLSGQGQPKGNGVTVYASGAKVTNTNAPDFKYLRSQNGAGFTDMGNHKNTGDGQFIEMSQSTIYRDNNGGFLGALNKMFGYQAQANPWGNSLGQQNMFGFPNMFGQQNSIAGPQSGPFGQSNAALFNQFQQLNTAINQIKSALSQISSMMPQSNTNPSAQNSRMNSGFPNTFGHATLVSDTSNNAQAQNQVVKGEGRIHGDPHFEGADGGKYDVQGKAGKTYNLLSDKGFQMNGRFDAWGDKGATVVGEVGITTRNLSQISVAGNGTVSVNGKPLNEGEKVDLGNGDFVEKKGKDITVNSGEWEVKFQAKGKYLNMDVKTDNANADGVLPHGLLGQSFDLDNKARNGDKGAGAQGGAAIEKPDGNMTAKNDKTTITGYEVNTLMSTDFDKFNPRRDPPSTAITSTNTTTSSTGNAPNWAQASFSQWLMST